jgi:hypothetical protein
MPIEGDVNCKVATEDRAGARRGIPDTRQYCNSFYAGLQARCDCVSFLISVEMFIHPDSLFLNQ